MKPTDRIIRMNVPYGAEAARWVTVGARVTGVQERATVLVVDDTDHVRRMLADLLNLDGFRVVACASGADEAVEAARAHQPAVAVVDYMLSGTDGLRLAPRLREVAPEVVIILYTAFPDPALEASAADAGVDAVLAKAEGLERLEREIARLTGELL